MAVSYCSLILGEVIPEEEALHCWSYMLEGEFVF
jgi:hypothetical protein